MEKLQITQALRTLGTGGLPFYLPYYCEIMNEKFASLEENQ